MRGSAPQSSGIAYAVLSVVGMLVLVVAEIDTETDENVLAHYADSGNRKWEIVGFLLVSVGVLFFLWFLSTLRSRIRTHEAEPGTHSSLAFGAGIGASVLLVGAAASLASTSFAAETSDSFVIDPNLARSTVSTGYLLLIGWVLISCVLMTATSVVVLRTAVLPVWLGWVGLVGVALALVEVLLLPVFVVPAWVVVVSIALMADRSTHDPEVREPALT